MRSTAIFPLLCLLVLVGPAAMASHNPWPGDMAALGDSITQAMNSSGASFGDHPENSWSTGYDARDGISSHYERIKAKDSSISNQNHNFAVSGAKMADLAAQADKAVAAGADYVTILLGANDVCASSKDAMTSVEDYRAQFRAGADRLKAGLPAGAKVYVVSVPDVYQLWKLYDGDSRAESVWSTFKICQSMLSNGITESDRQFVRQRNVDFNAVLQEEAAAYGFHFDGHAVFNYRFAKTDVSTLDYFHPSKAGQANLATVTWNAGLYAS